ncbi:hypothetical protein CSUI_002015 [Cystoisospora suis]|uniref:Uncharacterized protein n=1 Tax=Cystoisospora suis TaxID=483139 RepID=A0A2C6LAK4_9APIC|nr:hypothetical protein CSUI_002015 [Cystoisospora suis]
MVSMPQGKASVTSSLLETRPCLRLGRFSDFLRCSLRLIFFTRIDVFPLASSLLELRMSDRVTRGVVAERPCPGIVTTQGTGETSQRRLRLSGGFALDTAYTSHELLLVISMVQIVMTGFSFFHTSNLTGCETFC